MRKLDLRLRAVNGSISARPAQWDAWRAGAQRAGLPLSVWVAQTLDAALSPARLEVVAPKAVAPKAVAPKVVAPKVVAPRRTPETEKPRPEDEAWMDPLESYGQSPILSRPPELAPRGPGGKRVPRKTLV